MQTIEPIQFVPIYDKNSGQPVGHYQLSDSISSDRYFKQVYIESEHRGKGAGKTLYLDVANQLEEAGERLVSDPESFSIHALRVWLGLERDGKATRHGEPKIDAKNDVYGVSFAMKKLKDK